MGRNSGMFQDKQDQMAATLKNIEALLARQQGGRAGTGGSGGSGNEGGQIPHLSPKNYIVRETDDMDGVPDGETVTLEPGESKPLVRFDGKRHAILAVGAVDEPDVSYQLRLDYERTIGGRTNSPLGLMNNPFSFFNATGRTIPANQTTEYLARLDEDAASSVDLAARIHLEVLG